VVLVFIGQPQLSVTVVVGHVTYIREQEKEDKRVEQQSLFK